MSSRSARPALFALALALVATGFAGCSTLHGFAQGGSGQSPTAGAAISLPLGK